MNKNPKLGFVVCAIYYKELKTVIDAINKNDIEIMSIVFTCSNPTSRDKDIIKEQIDSFRQRVDDIRIITPKACAAYEERNTTASSCQYCSPETCTEMFVQKFFVNNLLSEGNYIVTPNWLNNWNRIVQNKWQFSRQTAKLFFKDTTKQIVVLDTGVCKEYSTNLNDFSTFVGLDYKIIDVGITYFKYFIENIVLSWRNTINETKEKEKLREANRKIADYAMAFDVIKSLSTLISEDAVINNILQFFIMLFSPKSMLYVPLINGKHGEIISYPPNATVDAERIKINPANSASEFIKSKDGFKIIIKYDTEVLGYFEINEIIFPEYLKNYIALTKSISSVFGLLIYNSRNYNQLQKENLKILKKNEETLKLKNLELQQSKEELTASNMDLRIIADALKQSNTELENERRKAEESNLLKSAFLANMSHEIRTPMNGILGFAELLKQPDLSGIQQKEYINLIEKGGQRMLNIINDIISISKIESGQMELHIQETNLIEQLEYIHTFFRPDIERKGMQFHFSNPLSINVLRLKTDREKLYAVLTNLVKNAIKYSTKGSIEIGFVQKKGLIELFVKDTGIGIAPDRCDAIFERFVQADITNEMAHQGAGLGLSISKAYVEMLGGKIWVQSEEGVGSSFHFTVANKSVIEKEESKAEEIISVRDSQANNKWKILLVEDDESSAILASAIVSKFAYETISVKSGAEAIEICRNTPDIDLILMDIQLPEVNGYEVTRTIRQFNQQVIIFAQTAYALSGDREKAIEAGCNDYIAKPLSISKLEHMIVAHLTDKYSKR